MFSPRLIWHFFHLAPPGNRVLETRFISPPFNPAYSASLHTCSALSLHTCSAFSCTPHPTSSNCGKPPRHHADLTRGQRTYNRPIQPDHATTTLDPCHTTQASTHSHLIQPTHSHPNSKPPI